MRSWILVSILFFITISYGQDKNASIYIDYANPASVNQLSSLRNLKDLRTIHFNNPTNFKLFSEHLQKVSKVENLEKIILSNYSYKKLPDEIILFEFINEVTLLSSPNLNLKNTFKQLGELFVLNKLNLANNNIAILPKEISLIDNLTELNITLNSELDLRGTLEIISNVKTIRKLGLPVNQLSEVPENIANLENLIELDLTNNNLTDLPNSISGLDSLKVLKLEKNIIVRPSDTYQKLEKLNIKYLSIDKGLSDNEISKLNEIFPNAKIEEFEEDEYSHEEVEKEMIRLKDSLRMEIMREREIKEDSINKSEVVIFNKPSKGVRVYSMAYRHYVDVFKDLPITNDFDSLLFEERFRDTNYYNTSLRQKGLAYQFIKLKLVKSLEKGQVWVAFEEDSYFYRGYPEMEAFNDMVWVLVGVTNKKQFKEDFVKDRSYSDFRLQYQPKDKNFKLILKSEKGFEEFIAVPRFPSKGSRIEKNQTSYEKRNIKYLEILNKRKLEFNKALFREKARYRFDIIRIRNKTWNDFQKMYFSDKEKSYSKEDWLQYYDEIIANELAALKRSMINKDFIIRTLQLINYKHVKNITEIKKEQGTQIGLFSFKDEKGNDLSVKKLFVVNKSLNHFKIYDGTVGLTEFYLFLRDFDAYSVIAILRNGDVAVTGSVDFNQIAFKQQTTNHIELKRLDKEITTINDMLNKSEL